MQLSWWCLSFAPLCDTLFNIMTKFEELPDKIKSHLKGLIKSTGLPDTEESLEMLSANWIEKEMMFREQTSMLGMVDSPFFGKDELRGALLLTYSGSLITIGTLVNNLRWVEYASIKLRCDVPEIVKSDKVQVLHDVQVGSCAEFEPGPMKKTSEIYAIAYCNENVSLAEQDKRIKEATIFLTNGFVKINRDLSINRESCSYQQFNTKAIIGYVAERNKITKKLATQIVEDYLNLIETGILLGERVSIGRLGNITLKMKPAQKARVGKNPGTGEEITIKAKPEMAVPRVSFTKYLKERAALVNSKYIS